LINNDLRNFVIIFILTLVCLCLTSFITPFWYDDVGHSLLVFQLLKNGKWAYPMEFPSLNSYELNSMMITMGPALHYPVTGFCSLFGCVFYTLRCFIIFFNAFFPIVLFHFSEKFFNKNSKFFSAILLLMNIQFLVYGSQYLGEIFMMLMIILGLYFQLLCLKNDQSFLFLVSQIFFYIAILTKEYIALPLGLYLLFSWIYWSITQKKFSFPLFLQGFFLPIASIIWYFFHFKNFDIFLDYWNLKSDYQSEFLYVGKEAFQFILKKPLILLGFFALLLKVAIKRNPFDVSLMIMQSNLILFFLLGRGYDRMGFLLVPISCLYLAEWIQFLWNFVAKNIYQKIFLLSIIIILFAQNTINPWYWKNHWNKNQKLSQISQKIKHSNIREFFTYEIEILPYLKDIEVKTTAIPPVSHHRIKEKIKEKFFLVGEYAKTEYFNTWDSLDYVKLWQYEGYEMWEFKSFKN